MIVFSRENFCETSNSLFHGYEFTGMACEYLSDLERLRKETLNLTCTCNGKLVFFRQFVHTQFGNGSGQHSGGVQVSECGGRCGISQVISGYI